METEEVTDDDKEISKKCYEHTKDLPCPSLYSMTKSVSGRLGRIQRKDN